MIEKGSKIGICACSNGQNKHYREKIGRLFTILRDLGYEPVPTDCLYETDSYFAGTGQERADALMTLYEDPMIKAIFDISGGDIANEVLDYLRFPVIKEHPKPFFGYSDVTTILNAIYTQTKESSGLYQIRNLLGEDHERQLQYFTEAFLQDGKSLFDFETGFIQGRSMKGIVIGGNIRCFLKLAGTPYMPDFSDKILFLEALNSTSPQVMTYLCQLKQLGAFERINGILLGTFTKLDREVFVPSVEELVQRVAGKSLPVARTMEIGHGEDSKCLWIGKYMEISSGTAKNCD